MNFTKEQHRGILIDTFGFNSISIFYASERGYRVDVNWRADNCISKYSMQSGINSYIELMSFHGLTINEAIDELLMYCYGPNWENIAANVYQDRKIKSKKIMNSCLAQMQEKIIVDSIVQHCLTGK